MSNIRVVLVDDHPLFREGVAYTLDAELGIEVVGQGGTAAEGIALARDLLPDLILFDIELPGGGVAAARATAEACPATKIVMLTVSEAEEDLLGAFRAGARGYILKGVSARELVRIVRAVAAGEGYVPPALAASLLMESPGASGPGAPVAGPLSDLTERERQILEGIATGQSNREIGDHLHLSEKTVKHYVTNVLQKLQVRNRVEAALLAQREDHRK